MYNPSSGSWDYPGAFAQIEVPGTPARGGVPEAPFDADEQRLYSELPPDV